MSFNPGVHPRDGFGKFTYNNKPVGGNRGATIRYAKPRKKVEWKGIAHDPKLNATYEALAKAQNKPGQKIKS